MTSTKAIAGGIGGAVAEIVMWLLTLIPHWSSIPPNVQADFQMLIVVGLPALFVYHAPANKFTKPILDLVHPTEGAP